MRSNEERLNDAFKLISYAIARFQELYGAEICIDTKDFSKEALDHLVKGMEGLF